MEQVRPKYKNPAAVALGKIKSPAKSKAARENGKQGGRPRDPKVQKNRAKTPRALRRSNSDLEDFCSCTRQPKTAADPRVGNLTSEDAAKLKALAEEMGVLDCMPVWVRAEIESKTRPS